MPDPVQQYIGRYRAHKVVGSGAFATVWLAEDEALAAPVAIKVLAENWSHDEEVRQRFLEEARILWRADSDHIIRIHNVDELPDGRPYFVMDFADRGTLDERMRGRIQAGGRYSISEAIAISLAIADGLKVAHALGIVHRDLKPANIMFQSVPPHHGEGRDEKLILTDFGMAKLVARSRGTTIATGTPHYMAPEQTEGRADERSDIYSAGVVLYELLAGRVPYPYSSPGQLFAAQVAAPPAPITTLRDDVPPGLEQTLMRALALDPAQRWPSAEAWAGALEAAARAEAAATPVPLSGADADVLRTMAPAEIAAAKAAHAASAVAAATPAEPSAVTPLPPPPPTPPPLPGDRDEGRRRRKRALAIGGPIALVVVAVVAAVLAIVVTGAKTADAKTLTLDPVSALGRNPFTSSAVPTVGTPIARMEIPKNLGSKIPSQLIGSNVPTALTNSLLAQKLAPVYAGLLKGLNVGVGLSSPLKLPLGSLTSGSGKSISVDGFKPGLYGGTQLLTVCDKKAMTAFLLAHADKLDAWAKAQGISPQAVAGYIGRLTDVVLQLDTRVTNHGFSNGSAYPIDEVLQAGTAVLIDEFGIPRARCYCGNPLTPPRPLASKVTIKLGGGLKKPWPGFTLKKTVAVTKSKKTPEFGLVDVVTGTTAVYRVPGSPPDASTLAPQLTAGIPTLSTPTPATTTTPASTTPTTTTPTTTTPATTTPTSTTPTSTTPTSTTPTPTTTPTTTTPSTTTPTSTTPSTTPTPPPISDLTSQGAVSASSTFSSQYPVSNAVDGNLATSWFSAGDKEGPDSTFTWTSGHGPLSVNRIRITSNVHNSNSSIAGGNFTFQSIQVTLLNNGAQTFTTTIPYPSAAATVYIGKVGDTVRLLLIHHTNPTCGGFGELAVFARPASTQAGGGSAAPPNLTGSWKAVADTSAPAWQLRASGPGLTRLHASWRGGAGHSGLVGSFDGMLTRKNGLLVYAGQMHVTEGSVVADGAMVIAIASANRFVMSYRQTNGVSGTNQVFTRAS